MRSFLRPNERLVTEDDMELSPIRGLTAGYPTVGGLHREFTDLITKALAWDQTFEAATGTYPTTEFAAGYRAFTDRVLRAQKQGAQLGSIVSYDFANLAKHDMWFKYTGATAIPLPQLDRMAKNRTPFAPYSGIGSTPWGSLLDGLISDLRRGERMLYAKLVTMAPTTPSTPNPGVPGSTYPGTGPRPTPIP
jgi:hypothetical protein